MSDMSDLFEANLDGPSELGVGRVVCLSVRV